MADQVQWHLSGDYFENCSCSVVCPCLVSKSAPLTSRPTEGVCNVPLIFHIESGSYGGIALDGLNVAAETLSATPESEDEHMGVAGDSLRVYSVAEQDHLGAECLGFLAFLESARVLPPALREIVVDRSMAAPGDPVTLDVRRQSLMSVQPSSSRDHAKRRSRRLRFGLRR